MVGWSFLFRSSVMTSCRRPVDSSSSSRIVWSGTMSTNRTTPSASATMGSE
jgi:hypothetical protein